MRENIVLQRRKTKSDRQNEAELSWIYGNLVVEQSTGRCFIVDLARFTPETKLSEVMVEVIPETVGQYTGLTDKNGKRIFEGDIGEYKQTDGAKRNGQPISCTGKVIYNTKTASYAVESKDEAGCKYFDYFPIKDFEVIGNIHDDKSLLNNQEAGE